MRSPTIIPNKQVVEILVARKEFLFQINWAMVYKKFKNTTLWVFLLIQ
jgi:hypothetical protein